MNGWKDENRSILISLRKCSRGTYPLKPETGGKAMSQTKKTKITLDMTVLDIVSQYRETEVVFKQYDEPAGECVCCNALFDTLEAVADKYHLDVQKIINDLKNVISSGK